MVNWGVEQTQQAYTRGTGTTSTNYPWTDQRDPTIYDIYYPIGKFWVNQKNLTLWYLNSQSNASGQLLSDWQLIVSGNNFATLSDTADTVVFPSPPTASPPDNIQLVGYVPEQTSPFSTIVAGSNLLNINPMSSARWIVDPLGFNGTHTTISGAIASATSGDTIFVLPGIYTENPTLKPGVNLTAYPTDAYTQNVIINGMCGMSGVGSATISGITLQTNSNYLLSITGASASTVYLVGCFLNVLNNNGVNFSSTSPSAQLIMYQCLGNVGTTGITYFTMTSPGQLTVRNSNLRNTNGSTTPSTFSVGGSPVGVFLNFSTFGFPMQTGGNMSLQVNNCVMPSVTHNGAATNSFIYNSIIGGGASASVTIGSASAMTLANNVVNSTATYALDGSGTLNIGVTTFINSSGINSTLTTNMLTTLPA